MLSELYPQIKEDTHTHHWQNPSLLLQNETFISKCCFVFKRHTRAVISIDIYKNQLNTDVLSVKHWDEWKNIIMHIHHNDLGFFFFFFFTVLQTVHP